MTSPDPSPDPDASLTRLFTVEQVADALQSSTRTVRRLISSGELSTVRIGRLVRIRPEAFAALLDQRKGGDRSGK